MSADRIGRKRRQEAAGSERSRHGGKRQDVADRSGKSCHPDRTAPLPKFSLPNPCLPSQKAFFTKKSLPPTRCLPSQKASFTKNCLPSQKASLFKNLSLSKNFLLQNLAFPLNRFNKPSKPFQSLFCLLENPRIL